MSGSYTVLQGLLTDISGTVWSNAKLTAYFVPAPNTQGPYYFGGNLMIDFGPRYSWSDSMGGVFFRLESNLDISPIGSQWKILIEPNSSGPAATLTLSLSTPTLDISRVFTQATKVALIQPVIMPRAYNDQEIYSPASDGQLYWNTTRGVMRVSIGGIWYDLDIDTPGGGGGGSCTGSANQILYLPSTNVCSGDPLFYDNGTSLSGGLSYTGNGAHFDAENSGAYTFIANDPSALNGAANTQFNLSSGGVNSATFGIRLDTSSGSGTQANSGNINLYTTGNSRNGNNIYLTAIANPKHGGSGNITIDSYGSLNLWSVNGSSTSIRSFAGIIVQSGSQATTFQGGIAPTTVPVDNTQSPYAIGSNNETTIHFNASGGAIIANLPTVSNDGRIYIFKRIDNTINSCSIHAAAGIIDGVAHYDLTTVYQYVVLQWSQWLGIWSVIGKN